MLYLNLNLMFRSSRRPGFSPSDGEWVTEWVDD
jgi:hypothetical protein